MEILIYIIIGFVIWWFVKKFLNQFKIIKHGELVLFSGGVKTGKTSVALATAYSYYRKTKRKIKFRNFFRKLFKKDLYEEPLFYSNIPVAFPYVQLTEDLLLRKKRFRFGSVIFCDEASLFADSQLIKDMDINERLLLFNKLISHELHGGMLCYNSQQIADVHYSIKRSVSQYFYVHHLTKWVPFFLIAYVQECKYSEDNSSINVNTGDLEDTLKKVIIRKSIWKKFDCYCHSSSTDDLEIEETIIENDKNTKNLKVSELVSFRNFKSLKGEEIEKKNN